MYQNLKHKEIVENRGDGYKYIGSYHKSETTLDNKNKKHNAGYIRVKCSYCGYEYDITLEGFKKGTKCNNCCHNYENSLAYHIQQELKEPLNKYWDWGRNTVNPYLIYKSTNKINIYIKCIKTDYHGSYEISSNKFHQGRRCPYCNSKTIHPKDSFAQWAIDNIDKDFMTKYWSDKNNINPFEISTRSTKKIWILCQEKDYHNDDGGYLTTCDSFYTGNRCPYCNSFASHKVHKLDSFGALYPEKAKYWSKNNKKTPYEVNSYSSKKYKFICEKCGKEFKRNLGHLNRNDTGVVCRECRASLLEQLTKNILDKYNIECYREYMFNDLIGIGNKNLRFDFYLPRYNTTIECQGIQHEKIQTNWQTKKQFEVLQEHDKRKKMYCKKNNIKLIEIWHYDINDIEEILINKLNLKYNN